MVPLLPVLGLVSIVDQRFRQQLQVLATICLSSLPPTVQSRGAGLLQVITVNRGACFASELSCDDVADRRFV